MHEDKSETLFHEARAIASSEARGAFLDEACGDDAVLRGRVDALLRADARAGGFLRTASVVDGVDRPDEEAGGNGSVEGPGSVIGRYTLVREIGEGGFGVVYLARQTEPLSREVALKVLKAGMDTRQILARFETERQSLARMDHPHIAGVYDAGTTAGGRPYFVMPLVDGAPITAYADEHDLDVRTRLELFRAVCAAVQHAHQKGVIHRDIKPSNILVTEIDGAPVPKVIDFGIAKATAPGDGGATVTSEGQFIGTPQYMSPEQAGISGIDVDTRTDVYALGVVLYELLTGTTPLDPASLRSTSFAEMQRVISESKTPRPSTRVLQSKALGRVAAHRRTDARALPPLLRRDLDWIVLKALEKDCARRYDAVSELAEDVRRYLDDEPVSAGPPGAGYRMRKFMKRHKAPVAAGLALAAALLIGIAGTTTALMWALATKRELAETNVALDRIVEFQSDRLRQIDPAAMGIGIRAGLLERAQAAMQGSGLDAAQLDANLARLDELLAGANFTTLAMTTLEENVFDEALATIDTQFEGEPLVQARLLQSLAMTLQELGLLDRAVDPQTRALEIRRLRLGDDDPQTLDSTANMAMLLNARGQTEESATYYERALDGRRRVLGDEHPRTIDSINGMGALAWSRGDLADAESRFRKALEGYRRVHGDAHEATLRAMGNLASLLQTQGRLDEAEPLFRRSYEGFGRVLGATDPHTLAAAYNLSQVLHPLGKSDEAERLAREALDGFRAGLGDDHPKTIAALNGLGTVLHAQERMDEAVVVIAAALKSRRRVLGDYHIETISSVANMGAMLRVLGRLDEAEPLGAESVRSARAVLPEGHWVIGALMVQHGRTLGAMERYGDSIETLLAAHGLLSAALGEGHPQTTECIELLAELYGYWHEAQAGQGYDAEARRWSERLTSMTISDG